MESIKINFVDGMVYLQWYNSEKNTLTKRNEKLIGYYQVCIPYIITSARIRPKNIRIPALAFNANNDAVIPWAYEFMRCRIEYVTDKFSFELKKLFVFFFFFFKYNNSHQKVIKLKTTMKKKNKNFGWF